MVESNLQRRYFFLVMMVSLSGCANSIEKPQSPVTECEDPKPQICTMIYDPVCGMTSDGLRKTYASGCSACSDAGVTGYEKGECSK